MQAQAVITNIQKFSVHDGPGIRSILFLKGCPCAASGAQTLKTSLPSPS